MSTLSLRMRLAICGILISVSMAGDPLALIEEVNFKLGETLNTLNSLRLRSDIPDLAEYAGRVADQLIPFCDVVDTARALENTSAALADVENTCLAGMLFMQALQKKFEDNSGVGYLVNDWTNLIEKSKSAQSALLHRSTSSPIVEGGQPLIRATDQQLREGLELLIKARDLYHRTFALLQQVRGELTDLLTEGYLTVLVSLKGGVENLESLGIDMLNTKSFMDLLDTFARMSQTARRTAKALELLSSLRPIEGKNITTEWKRMGIHFNLYIASLQDNKQSAAILATTTMIPHDGDWLANGSSGASVRKASSNKRKKPIKERRKQKEGGGDQSHGLQHDTVETIDDTVETIDEGTMPRAADSTISVASTTTTTTETAMTTPMATRTTTTRTTTSKKPIKSISTSATTVRPIKRTSTITTTTTTTATRPKQSSTRLITTTTTATSTTTTTSTSTSGSTTMTTIATTKTDIGTTNSISDRTTTVAPVVEKTETPTSSCPDAHTGNKDNVQYGIGTRVVKDTVGTENRDPTRRRRKNVVITPSVVPLSYQMLGLSEQLSLIANQLSQVAHQAVVESGDDVVFTRTHHYLQNAMATLHSVEALRFWSHSLVAFAETIPKPFVNKESDFK